MYGEGLGYVWWCMLRHWGCVCMLVHAEGLGLCMLVHAEGVRLCMYVGAC